MPRKHVHPPIPSPTWAQDDNVRPTFSDNPAMAVWKCTGGRGERKLMSSGFNCATCGYFKRDGVHCFLYERCDRCYDTENPCDAAREMLAEIGPVETGTE